MMAFRIAAISAGLRGSSSSRQLTDMLAASTLAALSLRGDGATFHMIELQERVRRAGQELASRIPSSSVNRLRA